LRRRGLGEPTDRGFVKQRIDARLLIEGEQFLGGLVAVGHHRGVKFNPIRQTRRQGFAGTRTGWRPCVVFPRHQLYR
jgi:hypothetical protein